MRFDDDETLDPRTDRSPRATVPILRWVYDGGTNELVDRMYRLPEGRVQIGRQTRGPWDVVLEGDRRASRLHATLDVGRGGRVRLVNESRYGTSVGADAVDERVLVDGDVIRVGDSFLIFRHQPPDAPAPGSALLGRSPQIVDLRAQIAMVAPTPATVLLLGESGTGKEVAAREIHRQSGRAGPFVAINSSAIPENLAESQLFGHKAGAFTGATKDHPGYFQQAEGGTLFLDELGELPPLLQPKLLRVLDERTVLPVGATRPVPVDVRLVAATNRDLSGAIASGAFRGDLYARVAEITLKLPPLRERREDVLPLLASALGAGAPSLSPELVHALLVYAWPFNVRELFKVATELNVRGAGHPVLELELVEGRLSNPVLPSPPLASQEGDPVADEDSRPLPIPGRDELIALLREHKGVIADVARETGRSRKQVYRWLDQHGLDAADFRDGEG